MTMLGWIFLVVSWGLIIGFSVFCFYRVFRTGGTDTGSDMK